MTCQFSRNVYFMYKKEREKEKEKYVLILDVILLLNKVINQRHNLIIFIWITD